MTSQFQPITKGMLCAALRLVGGAGGESVFAIIEGGHLGFSSYDDIPAATEGRQRRSWTRSAISPDFGDVYRFWTGEPFQDDDPAPLATAAELSALSRLLDGLGLPDPSVFIYLERDGLSFSLIDHSLDKDGRLPPRHCKSLGGIMRELEDCPAEAGAAA
jgi:hypothetical protein